MIVFLINHLFIFVCAISLLCAQEFLNQNEMTVTAGAADCGEALP